MSYTKEKTLLASTWIICFFLLIFLVPKEKRMHAYVAFLFKQLITWSAGLIVAEKGWIKYPYREFKKSNTSFTFEYFVFPTLSALFNVHYPEKKSIFVKGLYYLFFTAVISLPELYAVRNTKLIKYCNWTWYWSFISIWLTFYISRIHYRWFFKCVD
ncbi:hypothetical protein J2S74_000822 [Evansella vedderi]|uniref:Uncharacterized protein n=1 Tax=Evansella vedderi TaxID=38282 RepID=A0ABT9ZTF9_9BACI|nr:CBO0543 family protein [Evansella vedderi]MDQ0253450.1 hypothetical protein [Evansella vedderi]